MKPTTTTSPGKTGRSPDNGSPAGSARESHRRRGQHRHAHAGKPGMLAGRNYLKALVCAVGVVLVPPGAPAGAMDRAKIYDKLGFAGAAVEACPRLALNPAGVLELMKSLDADDQAALAAGLSTMERHKQVRGQLFALLGDASCDAALDFEDKLGIDIFIESPLSWWGHHNG